MKKIHKKLALTAGGGTITIKIDDLNSYYHVVGSDITLTSNLTIQTDSDLSGHVIEMYWSQKVTLNGNTVTLFGNTISGTIIDGLLIKAVYNGSTWDIFQTPAGSGLDNTWNDGVASVNSATAWNSGDASGDYSTAWNGGIASGSEATAWNSGDASGSEATAWNSGDASGDYSTAWNGGIASGDYSTAWNGGIASENSSTAFNGGDASGDSSTAFNDGTASGDRATAWSGGTASGYSATAWSGGDASGDYSTAWSGGDASGSEATAFNGGRAQSYLETSFGPYVDTAATTSTDSWVATDRLLTIGNGTLGSPSNALVMLKNGNTEVSGVWTFGAGISVVNNIIDVTASTYAYNPADDLHEAILAVAYTVTGAVAISLDAGVLAKNTKIIIKDTGGNASVNNITITPDSGLIDGAASLVLSTDYESVTLFTDGTNFFVV